jgi:hypothetical protein
MSENNKKPIEAQNDEVAEQDVAELPDREEM